MKKYYFILLTFLFGITFLKAQITPGLQLPFGIQPVNPVPVDANLGPFTSTAQAIAAIPQALRYDGLTVQVTGSGNYWWLAADLSNTGLKLKTAGAGWLLTGNSGTTAGTNFLGTIDSIPLYFKTHNLTNLVITPKSGNVGIGTTSPGWKLDVNGTINSQSGYNMSTASISTNWIGTTGYNDWEFRWGGSMAGGIFQSEGNAFLGGGCGSSIISGGYENTGMGASAFVNNTSGADNTSMGEQAMYTNTTGSQNTAIGYYALESNLTGNYNTAIGYEALGGSTASGCIAIGSAAGYYNTLPNRGFIHNYLVGTTLRNDTTKSIAYFYMGIDSSQNKWTFNGKLRINDGTQSNGYVFTCNADGTGHWAAGGGGATGATGPTGLTGATGATGPTGSFTTNAWQILGNSGTVDGTNFIGTTDNVPLSIYVNNQKSGRIDNTNENVFFGYTAGASISSGTHNTGIGGAAMNGTSTTSNNTAVGYAALNSNTGTGNSALGVSALTDNSSGSNNTAIGLNSMAVNSAGSQNTCLGWNTMDNNFTGWNNTAIGANSLTGLVTGGVSNTAVGYYALHTTSTSQNTAVGDSAGFNNSNGHNNTFVGFNATGSQSVVNSTAIGSNSSVTASNALVLGSSVNVGIGTTAPTAFLNIGSSGGTVPPFQLTSGTNVGTAVAGGLEYDGTSLFFTNGGAQRQQLPQVQMTRVTSKLIYTTTTSLAPITGLTATLVAGKSYKFLVILYDSCNTSGGWKVDMNGGTATTNIVKFTEQIARLDNTAETTISAQGNTLATSLGNSTPSGNGCIVISGLITVVGAGTLLPEFAQNAGTGSSALLSGCTFTVTQIP